MMNAHQRVSENREPGRANMPSWGRFSIWHDIKVLRSGSCRYCRVQQDYNDALYRRNQRVVSYTTPLVQASADPEMLYRSETSATIQAIVRRSCTNATHQYSLSNSAKQTVLSPAIMLASHVWPPFRIPPPSPPPPCCSRPFEVDHFKPLVLLASKHI